VAADDEATAKRRCLHIGEHGGTASSRLEILARTKRNDVEPSKRVKPRVIEAHDVHSTTATTTTAAAAAILVVVSALAAPMASRASDALVAGGRWRRCARHRASLIDAFETVRAAIAVLRARVSIVLVFAHCGYAFETASTIGARVTRFPHF